LGEKLTLPFWVWAAAAAAGFGVVGAVIGWVAERSGFKFGRYLSIAAIAGGLAFTRSDGFRNFVQYLSWTDAQSEAAMNATSPDVYHYIQQAYPDDYRSMVSQIAAIMRSSATSADDTVERKGAEMMEALRHRYASFVKFASASDLRDLIQTQTAVYDAINQDDPDLCAKIAVDGPMSVVGTGFAQKYLGLLNPQVVALFKAARSGQDAPIARSEPTDDDWAAIGDKMRADGAPPTYLAAISNIDASNPDTCPALVRMLKAMGGLSTSSGEAVMAAYLAEVAAG
jgi:hypothetical protein